MNESMTGADALRPDSLSKVERVRNAIFRDSNPNPVLVTVLIVLILTAVWMFYTMLLKPNASGTWKDMNGNEWLIDHGKWTDGLMIEVNQKDTIHCYMKNNMFKCGDDVGIWNYDDIIVLVGKEARFTMRKVR